MVSEPGYSGARVVVLKSDVHGKENITPTLKSRLLSDFGYPPDTVRLYLPGVISHDTSVRNNASRGGAALRLTESLPCHAAAVPEPGRRLLDGRPDCSIPSVHRDRACRAVRNTICAKSEHCNGRCLTSFRAYLTIVFWNPTELPQSSSRLEASALPSCWPVHTCASSLALCDHLRSGLPRCLSVRPFRVSWRGVVRPGSCHQVATNWQSSQKTRCVRVCEPREEVFDLWLHAGNHSTIIILFV